MSALESDAPDAFSAPPPECDLSGFEVQCDPGVVEVGGTVKIVIRHRKEQVLHRAFSLRLTIRDSSERCLRAVSVDLAEGAKARLTLAVTMDETASADEYTVSLSVANQSNYSLAFLTVAEPGALAASALFFDAVAQRQTAFALLELDEYSAAVEPLRRAAETYSGVHAIDAATSAWYDLAFVYMRLGRRLESSQAIRRVLSPRLLLPVDAETDSDEHVQLTRLLDAFDVRSTVHPPFLRSLEAFCPQAPTNYYASAVVNLLWLGERGPELEESLRNVVMRPDLFLLAYVGLSTIDCAYAIIFLPDLVRHSLATEDRLKVELALSMVIAAGGPGEFYPHLQDLRARLTSPERLHLLGLLDLVCPVDAITDDTYTYLFLRGERPEQIAKLLNEDDSIGFLLPLFATGSYSTIPEML